MSNKKQKDQTITINDTEYKVDDLTQEQIAMVNHVADLDRKLSSAQFNLDQLTVGRSAFLRILTDSLTCCEASVKEEEAVTE